MPHGKPKDGIVVISSKVPISMKNELDKIVEQLNLSHRSDVIKIAVNEFIETFQKNNRGSK